MQGTANRKSSTKLTDGCCCDGPNFRHRSNAASGSNSGPATSVYTCCLSCSPFAGDDLAVFGDGHSAWAWYLLRMEGRFLYPASRMGLRMSAETLRVFEVSASVVFVFAGEDTQQSECELHQLRRLGTVMFHLFVKWRLPSIVASTSVKL